MPASSRWGASWLMMAGINQAIGQKAAGMTNSSDFSRYARKRSDYLIGTISVYWITGVLVCFGGLVTTAACQKIYGQIWWNPPDLLMVMMDRKSIKFLQSSLNLTQSALMTDAYVFPNISDGQGSSAARAGVFFASLAFAFTSMFENVCSNAVAGGIDLAELFPRYIDIRRGALLTFCAAWVIQPWQLINEAATFVAVLNSFAVFLAPIIGRHGVRLLRAAPEKNQAVALVPAGGIRLLVQPRRQLARDSLLGRGLGAHDQRARRDGAGRHGRAWCGA